MLLPEILILLKNSIFTTLYNVGHVGLPPPPRSCWALDAVLATAACPGYLIDDVISLSYFVLILC